MLYKQKDALRRQSIIKISNCKLREASRGFEPLMRVLQTLALPLGHDAIFKITERAVGFEPTTFSLARRRTTTVLRPHFLAQLSDRECRDPGSNWGHRDFQSRALPTELSRPDILLLSVRDFTL